MEQLGPQDPRRIGSYRLLGRLGEGGMGRVYLARSDRGRTVAVKLVHEALARQEEFRVRFRHEVRAALRVGDTWTAPVLDADTEADVPWVATGYIAGPSLHRVVGEDHGPLPERSVRLLAAGLARALRAIHEAGIVHRDLKPSNVLVTIDGPRVIDFGIARALEGTVSHDGLTGTGSVVGSPGFLSPEQVRGESLTTASDVFCLGSVLAYAATGRLPFGSDDSGVHAMLYRIVQEEPELSELPEGIRELIARCLAKDPTERPTPDELLTLATPRAETGPEGEAEADADGEADDDREDDAPDDGEDDHGDDARGEKADKADKSEGSEHGEPWLPASLIAQLGRHATGLLDAENPHGDTVGDTGGGSGGGSGRDAQLHNQPTAVGAPVAALPPAPARATPAYTPPPAPRPAPVAPAAHPGAPAAPGQSAHPGQPGAPGQPAYGYPPHQMPPHRMAPHPGPPPERSAAGSGGTAVLLAVLVAVLAVVSGVTAYMLLGEGDADRNRTPQAADSTAPQADDPSGPDDGATKAPSPSDTAGTADEGGIPAGFLGGWEREAGADGAGTLRIEVGQGEIGDTVLTIVAEGPSYRCEFEADLRAPGPPVELGTSRVTAKSSEASCQPGPTTALELTEDGSLRRTFDDGRAPHLYSPAG